jgi:general nucleoside transport system permease protein
VWTIDVEFLRAVMLFATPLLVAAIGELVVERAGVVNIGIEGMMLAGAVGAWLGNVYAGPAAGVAAGVASGMIAGLVFAAVVLAFAADQIVTGTGINLLALGATGLLFRRFEGTAGEIELRVIAPAWLALVVPVLAAALWVFFTYTRAGLELVAVGESPAAADAAGVAVNRRRLAAILFGAACAGLAGAYLSTMRVRGFAENMTEGLGFLALAIVIFGRWNPWWVLAGGLFFGLVRAYADRLIVRGGFQGHVSPLFQMLPYVVSLMVLAGFAGRSRGPAALGKAYARE